MNQMSKTAASRVRSLLSVSLALAIALMLPTCTPDAFPAMKDENARTGINTKENQVEMPIKFAPVKLSNDKKRKEWLKELKELEELARKQCK